MTSRSDAREAFLEALTEGSQGTAYVDSEEGHVVIDGHFDVEVLDAALAAYSKQAASALD